MPVLFLCILKYLLAIILYPASIQMLYANTPPEGLKPIPATVFTESDANRALLNQAVIPINHIDDYAPLIKRAADAHIVLIGDSTHGTHEFYRERVNISKRLIQEQKYTLIALEASWPDFYFLNQYIHGSTERSLADIFKHFVDQPDWLWKNRETLEFIQWLKHYNARLPATETPVSVYGIDLYSFQYSRSWVSRYLQQFSALAAQQALQRYQCLSRFNNDLHNYGFAVTHDPSNSCESGVTEQYLDFTQCRFPCPEEYSFIDADDFFAATQNARIIKNIEKNTRIYHSTSSPVQSWNLRDEHMLETLLALFDYLNHPKAIVWAHNSHLGDASATGMAEKNQLNLGQLLRQHFKRQVFSIGMLTFSGKIVASDKEEKQARMMRLLPAHPDSNEAIFHQLNIPLFLLFLDSSSKLKEWLNETRPQRHVGVFYNPQEEIRSHYSYTHLADQFDAVLYIDSTHALMLLE